MVFYWYYINKIYYDYYYIDLIKEENAEKLIEHKRSLDEY
jgi:hypothetical protein